MAKHKINIILTVVLVLGSLLASPTPLDHKSMSNIDDALARALQSFALARSLNAVISAAQGTEISVEPFGLGVTFTPGQVLDPVNDLIERFSWIMLASSTSIGIQKIFLEISIDPAIKQVLIVIFLGTLALVWIPVTPKIITEIFIKLSFILIFLRLSVPIIFILNELVYTHFLSSHYQQSTAAIKNDEKVLNNLTTEINIAEKSMTQEESITLLGKFTSTFKIGPKIDAIKVKTAQLKQQITEISDQISASIVNLIAVFIIKTIFFPILFLLGVYKTTLLLSRLRFPS
jgi:hypothetical protein